MNKKRIPSSWDSLFVHTWEFGVIETVRFLRQFTNGYGDYQAERAALLGNKLLPELLAEIKRYNTSIANS